MKFRASLIIPVLAASIVIPTVGSVAAANNNTDSSNPTTSAQHEKHKGGHHKGDKQQQLTEIINQYASPQLKEQLTKDLATHKGLEKQLHQTSGFQKKAEQKKQERESFYQAHKQEIDSIQQQVKEGKLTKQQAHQQLKAIFGQQTKDKDKKDKFESGHAIQQELKAAVEKKDKAAVNSALEKLDQQIQNSNQKLQQEISANK